ncbi:hypothetical protein [Clostridium weizhouense]|uniref:ABC-2 family transporter protein n=1 Tax=Clostridium weizhouense TaxID=2859781 RepID=A0ABS7ATI2_9CLOT|nr:hypothetical protein [Clostridium weizhouense]MBW6410790.1 hypothetical protein [Clostridium weizhouense]
MKKEIDFPSLEEVNVEINKILDKGFKKKKGFFQYIISTIKELGFKNIFHDKSELIFISIVSLIFFGFIGNQVVLDISRKDIYIYKLYEYIFIVSPIIYVIISLFSFINTRLKGTYEIEAVCKYNMYNLAAIRMFIFSIASMFLNSFLIVVIYFMSNIFNIIRAYVVSITSLFLFSTIFILTIIYLKRTIYKYLAISAWILVNLILMINENLLYINLITQAPLYIHLIVTIICIIIYIKALKRLIYVRKETGEV